MKQILLFSLFIFSFSFSQDTLMVQGEVQGMFYIPECMCAPFVLVDDSMNINYAIGTTPYESVAYQEYADQQVIVTAVLSEYPCEGFCDEFQPALQVISIELAETEPEVTLSFGCPDEVVAGSEGNTLSIIMENEVYVGGIELYVELSSQNIEITNIMGGELVYINYTSWYYSDSTQIYILSFSIGTGLMIPPGVGILFNIEFSGLDLGGDVQLEFSNVVMEGSNPNPIENIDYSDTCTISVVEPNPQIGGECESPSGGPGLLDCSLMCIDEDYLNQWLGDGFCDESWIITFNCEEFGYDCGDCNEDWDGTDQLGLCGEINYEEILVEVGIWVINWWESYEYLVFDENNLFRIWSYQPIADFYCLVDGTYSVTDNYLSITNLMDSDDCFGCSLEDIGVYSITIDENGDLTLHLVQDDCEERGSQLNQLEWDEGNGWCNPGSQLFGDFNADAQVDVLDVVVGVNKILGIEIITVWDMCHGDVNEDGELNILDIVMMVNIILEN